MSIKTVSLIGSVVCLVALLLSSCGDGVGIKKATYTDLYIYPHDHPKMKEIVEATRNNMVYFKNGDKCFGMVVYRVYGCTSISITQVTGCPEFGTQ
jgi:hypothetical protein